MPDRNGIALVREIRESTRDATLPILLVTASAPALGEALGGGIVPIADWVENPSDCDGIVRAVRHIAKHTARAKPRVLLVEAYTNVSRVVSMVLGGMAELTVAADAREAQAWLDASEYDLAVLDPGHCGFELLPALGASEPAVPVLVSAARSGSTDIARDIAAALESSTLTADLVLAGTRAAIAAAPPPNFQAPDSLGQPAPAD